MTEIERKTKNALDRIEAALDRLGDCLLQEKADFGKQDWPDVGDLHYVATELENVRTFWTGEEPSCQEK